MPSPNLDEIDRQLISALQINARESVALLARKLGIARTTVTSRIARLEKTKAITGYGVRLGQQLIDGGLQAYVGITVQSRAGENVVRRMNSMAQVEQLCAVSGEFDYVAWLRSDSPEQLDRLLDQIGELEGVAKTTTPIVHHLEWENRQGAATLGASNFYEQRYRQIARSDGAFRLR